MAKEDEIWRLSPSLPDYLVSNWGGVMRAPFVGEMPHGGPKHYGGTPHVGQWEATQRRYVMQYRGKTYRIARLVCEAFNGPPPFDEAVCMHLDEDSRNNAAGNLAWGTQRENMNAPKFKAWQRTRTGDRSTRAIARRKMAGE